MENNSEDKNRFNGLEYIQRSDLGKGVIEVRKYNQENGEEIPDSSFLCKVNTHGSYKTDRPNIPVNEKSSLVKRILTDIKNLFRKEYEYSSSIDSDGNFLLKRFDKKTGEKDTGYSTKLVTMPRELL